MYFTHESRYLHAQLSGEAVIILAGHFNWSAVLVTDTQTQEWIYNFDRLVSNLTTPGRGGEAAWLLSACCNWTVSQVQAPADQALDQAAEDAL